jgi:V8-like Glu-specific endopeptidase
MKDEKGDGWRCSGTMLSPTVVLTAGHCTNAYPYPEYTEMRIFTESDVENGTNSYPEKGKNSIEVAEWYAHPLYETAPFFYHDVGVVILKKPFKTGGVYGELPTLNQLDKLKIDKKEITFTSVGYGMQKSFPTAAEWKDQADKIRMVAYPKLIQINTPGFTGEYSLLLSNNAHTGGTCFGDSGGPNFLGDSNIVAGVTSFGMNVTCAGTGGVFRMDREDVLDFVNQFLE